MKRRDNESLAAQIAARITRSHQGAANYLNRKTAYWNRASKLIALALFCLLFGGICMYLILKAI